MGCQLWGARYGLPGMRCQVWGARYGVPGMGCQEWCASYERQPGYKITSMGHWEHGVLVHYEVIAAWLNKFIDRSID